MEGHPQADQSDRGCRECGAPLPRRRFRRECTCTACGATNGISLRDRVGSYLLIIVVIVLWLALNFLIL